MLENTSENSTLSSDLGDKKVNNKGMIQKVFMYIVLLFGFLMVGALSGKSVKADKYDSWYNEDQLVVGTGGSNGDSYNCLFIWDMDGPTNQYGGRYPLVNYDSDSTAAYPGVCNVPTSIDSSAPYLFGSKASLAKLIVSREGTMTFYRRNCRVLGICGNWIEVRTINLWTFLAVGGHTKASLVGHRLKFEITGGNKTDGGEVTVPKYYFDSSTMVSVNRDNANWQKSHTATVVSNGGTGAKTHKVYGCWGTSVSDRCTSNEQTGSTSHTYSKNGDTGTYYLNGKVCHTHESVSNGTWDPTKDDVDLGDFTICDTASSAAMSFDNESPVFGSFSDSDGDAVHKKGYTITATFTEAKTSVGATEYCWSTSSSSRSSCASTSSSISGVTGTYYLHARARDTTVKGAGGATADYNWSSWSVSAAFKLDNNAPTFSSFSTDGSTTWSKDYSVTATFTDGTGESGVKSTQYCWNTNSTRDSVSDCTSTSGSLTPSASGIYYLHARAWDNSLKGTQSSDYNYSGWSISKPFYVDVVAPTVKTTFSPNGNDAYVKSVSVSITYEDDKSGVGAIQYCWTTSSTATSCSSPSSATVSSGGASISSGTNAGEFYLIVRARDTSVKGAASSDYNYSGWTKSNVFYLGVAQIGTTEYHTLADALTNVSTNGTIKMLTNVTECVSNSKTITLNLNGKTISCATTTITNSGTLTISGTGTIKTTATSGSRYGISNSGTLTINSGTISSDTKNVDTVRAVYNNGTITIAGGTLDGGHGLRNDGTMTITGGTITGYYYGINTQGSESSTISGATISATMTDGRGIYAASSGKIVINTGASISGTTGIYITGTATVEVKSGTITGTSKGIDVDGGTVTVNGSSVSISGESMGIEGSGGARITLTSGTIESGDRGVSTTGASTITINGASVTGAGAGILDSGGTVTVESGQITGSHALYLDWGTVANVSSGTITGTSYGVFMCQSEITISGGTISSAGTGLHTNASPCGNSTVQIRGGTIKGVTHGINNNYGTVTISSGTVINTNTTRDASRHAIINRANMTMNISGGTIWGYYAAIFNYGTLNVSGGTIGGSYTISGTSYASDRGIYNEAVYVAASGSTAASKYVSISNGTISGAYYGVQNKFSTTYMTISGGTISGTAGPGALNRGTMDISGGTFSGTSYGLQNSPEEGNQGTVWITGGSFSGTTGGIYNNATATRAMTLNGSSYTVTVGIGSDSSVAANISSLVNASASTIVIDGVSDADPAKVTGTVSNSNSSGIIKLYIGSKVEGTITNVGQLDVIGGITAAITNNQGGTVSVTRGSTGAITNNSTTTRAGLVLGGSTYTATIGVGSDSSYSTTVASISNTVAGIIYIDGQSASKPATVSGAITNSNANGQVWLYIDAYVNGTITNAGQLNIIGGTVKAITNNANGTILMQRGSTQAITNNSTTTRAMSLAGASYTATVGISSDSSAAATVASLSNTVGGKVVVKGYSSTNKATISGSITNSNKDGEVTILANSVVNGGISNGGKLTIGLNSDAVVTDNPVVSNSNGFGIEETSKNAVTTVYDGVITGKYHADLKTTTACKGYDENGEEDVGCNEIVDIIPSGYGFVTLKDGNLVDSYLVESGARIKLKDIPDSVHDTLSEAITNVDELYNDEGTIIMLDSFTVCPMITSGLTITLDLNGKTITCSEGSTSGIQNYGTLVVKDSSTGGTIQSSSWHGVYNEGTLTLQSGKLKGNKYGINNKGTLTVSGGTIEGLEYGIYNDKNSTSAVAISGGTIKATGTYASNITYAMYSVAGTVAISGGTIEGPKGIHSVGVLNISGGTVKGTSYHALSASGTVNISGGTISTTAGSTESLNGNNVFAIHVNGTTTISGSAIISGFRGIKVESGKTLNITNGTITSTGGYGIQNVGTLTMSNGTVTGYTTGIYSTGTLNVSGGSVLSTNTSGYGIQVNAGTTTISKGNANVGTYIYSPYYAIYNETGTLVVNNGVIGQKADGTTAARGIQNGLNGSKHSKGTTINGGKVIGTAYGISNSWGSLTITNGEVIGSGSNAEGINNNVNSTLTISNGTVEGKKYGIYSVATSGSAITISGGTIKSTGTYANDITYAMSLTSGTTGISESAKFEGPKGIYIGASATLDMSGGSVESRSFYAINSYGNTTISGGDISSSAGNKENLNNWDTYVIAVQGGTTTISGGNIEGYRGIYITASSTRVNITGGTISGTTELAIYNAGTIVMNGGTVTGTSTGIHNAGTLTINSGTINGRIAINTSNVLEVNGGEISGSTYGIQNSSTKTTAVTINNGEITGTTRGISSGAGTVNVVNGTITGTTRGIHISAGTLNVSGGSVTGTNEHGIWNDGATVNVSGGTITGKTYAIGNTGTLNVEQASGKNVSIYGVDRGISTTGTVQIKSGTVYGGNDGIVNAGTITVSGGTIYTPTSGKNGIQNINTGVLTVSGGVVTSNGGNGIKNTSTYANSLTISGGTIGEATVGGTTYKSENGVQNAVNSQMSVTSGTIKGTTAGIDSAGTLSVSGGTISSVNGISNSGTATLSGGNITGTADGILNTGTVTVTGGTIRGTTASSGNGINNSGIVTIGQGEGKTTSVTGYNKGLQNTGTATITGGEVSAALNAGTGNLTVSGGTVSGWGYGITNNSTGTVTITGGTVSSTSTSATTGAIKTSAGKVIIGSSAGTPSNFSPIIQSAGGFGIYETAVAAKVEVYDGIIRGKYSSDLKTTTACKGYDSKNSNQVDVGCNEIVDVMPSGYGFTVEYDSTNGVASQYLVQAGARIVRSDPDTVETTIQAAINKVENYYSGTGTIYLLKDSNENVSIKAGLNIIINLNSTKWSCSAANTSTISNRGALTIEGTGTVESTLYYGIYNSEAGTLLIKSGNILGKQFAIRNVSTSNSAVEIREGIIRSTSTDAYSGLYISAGTATINGGLIEGFRGIFSEGSTTIVNINGGEVKGSNSYGVYNATSATLNVGGGKITGVDAIDNFSSAKVHVTGGTLEGTTLGIYNSSNAENAVEISGGTIVGGQYALKTYYGHVIYTGGTLRGSTTNNYVYEMASGVTYSTGTKSEYTVIEGSQYVTTLVNAIEGSSDGTIKSNISAITSNGEIKLVGNMTEASIEIPAGKHITLDLNGNLLNSYITQRVATVKDSTPFITVKGELTIVGGSIEMYNELADLIYVEENGVLNIGRSSDDINVATPSLEVKDEDGKNVVHAQEWGRVNYNNGVIKNGIDKFTVQYNDLYIREGYYIEHTASEMKLIADLDGSKPLGLEPLYNDAESKNNEVKITVSHENKVMEDSEQLLVYLRGKVTEEEPRGKEHALECTSAEYKTTCTIEEDKIGYVYNAVYEDKLLYVYTKEAELNRLKVIRDDLEIIPNLKNTSGYTKEPILSLQTKEGTAEPGKRYDILSDGEILLIDLLDGLSDFSLLDINHSEVKLAIFGDNWENVYDELNIQLNVVEKGVTNIKNGYVTISYASINIINRTELNGNYEVPDDYTFAKESSPKILIYDHSPKVDSSAAGAASLVTCEYGGNCAISPLSFYDYLGNEIRDVETVITRDGEIVEAIDTSVLGTYVVTTTATDMFGYTSLPVVQEYVVKDDIAPVLKVSEEALVINKGSLLNDLDEIEVSDNYDRVLMVERIDSEIDVNKAGTYKLGYKVVDSNGNETIVYRDVIVKDINNSSNVWLWYVIGITLLLGVIGIVSFMYIKKRR